MEVLKNFGFPFSSKHKYSSKTFQNLQLDSDIDLCQPSHKVSRHKLLKMSSEQATAAASDIAFQKAHLQDDRRLEFSVCLSSSLIIAYIAVLLRLISRRLSRTKLGKDDVWIFIGLVRFFTFTI